MLRMTSDRLRTIASENLAARQLLNDGFNSQINGLPRNIWRHVQVARNDFFVNDEFELDPQWFVAHFADNDRYRILRVIYVRDELRGHGTGSAVVREIQKVHFPQPFLQVGVRLSDDVSFARLDRFYSRLGFKDHPTPIAHGNGISFVDFFWSQQPFEVLQQGSMIAARHT